MTATMLGAPAPEPAPGPERAPTLHPVPERRTVVKEQVEAVSIAIRKEQYFFLGTLAAFAVLGIYAALRVARSDHGNAGLGPINAAATIPVTLVALLIPFGVWRASDRERRAYDWTMPVPQSTHTLIKMAAGWLWVMIGVVVYLLVIAALGLTMAAIAGGQVYAPDVSWQVLVPFTAASIAYLLTSIPMIGSAHPWRWIGGIIIGYLVALLVLDILHLHDFNRALQQVMSGYYGLAAAIFGDVSARPHHFADADPSRWLGATLLWGALAIVGVWLAARWHPTS